jgi:hypothetical protein
MTNQTIEQAVEEIVSTVETVEFLHGVPVNLPSQYKADLRGVARKALQAQRDAGAREVELIHFVWCPQCGDALEQTGTQNKYNCFGCDTDYQLQALTPPTK